MRRKHEYASSDCSLSNQERSQQKALWNIGHLWPNGCTLVVRYLNGNAEQQAFVEICLREWESYANIKFDICYKESTRSDIRIFFNSNGINSYRGVGTGSCQAGDIGCTMQLSLSSDLVDLYRNRRFVLHEFGHALGMEHEHQSPNRPYRIKKEEAYAGHPEMTPEEVDNNIVQIRNGWTIIFPHDPYSIMSYGLAAEIRSCIYDSTKPCTLDLQHPLLLSDGDKRKIAAIYPKPAGADVNMLLNGTRQQHNITFPQHPMCPPRVILGLKDLMWEPKASASADVVLKASHIQGDGCFIGLNQPMCSLRGQLAASYIIADPLIRDICSFEIHIDDKDKLLYLQETLLAFPTEPVAIFWLKSFRLEGPHNHNFGGIHTNFGDLENFAIAPYAYGALSDVTLSCFVFSQGARNIHAGHLMLQRQGLFLVPKSKFSSKPEIISGVSSLQFSYQAAAHPMWFRMQYQNVEPDHEYCWAFWGQVECCHDSCFPVLEYAWVAVARSYELVGDKSEPDIRIAKQEPPIRDTDTTGVNAVATDFAEPPVAQLVSSRKRKAYATDNAGKKVRIASTKGKKAACTRYRG